MSEQLSRRLRPRTFNDVVGQKPLLRELRVHFGKDKIQALCLTGGTGCGKTTLALIIALSLQCTHQEEFGSPCAECQKNVNNFDIFEINCADMTGINELREIVKGSHYDPRPGSKFRVYILDELQEASKSAQTLLYKYFERTPESTIWIVCTTDPERIKPALLGRCVTYPIPGLSYKGVSLLVKRTLRKVKSDKPAGPLADALNENGINLGRHIVQACTKYIAGSDPIKAAIFKASNVDTYALCRQVTKGDWDAVRVLVQAASPEDAASIRAALTGWLKTILLDSAEISDRTTVVAKAILHLAEVQRADYSMQLATVASVLYTLCMNFQKYSR